MSTELPPLDASLARPPRAQRPRLRPRQLLRWCRTADAGTLRAAVWTIRACRRVHASPDARGLQPPPLPKVPGVPAGAILGVEHVLWLRGERCLVSASVRQAWLAAHGCAQDVVIGVRVDAPGELHAHAWLAEEQSAGAGYEEIARVPPRPA